MLPIVAVQIAPAPVAPAVEDQLLRACSAGLERARCVSARGLGGVAPRGVAVVSWASAEHVSIEVGLAGSDPLWVSRELAFASADPESERWRAVGFTIALLADDPRFWPEPEVPAPSDALIDPGPSGEAGAGEGSAGESPAGEGAWLAEVRALGGSGIVSGPPRVGAELRLSAALSPALFVTGGVEYALARDGALDVRWFDARLGAGLRLPGPLDELEARLRVELVGENVAVAVRGDASTERQSAWVPGVSIGGDLLWAVSEVWRLGARADVFWLDGSTAIVSAGQRLGAVAGAGLVLGLGAGYRF